MVRLDYSEIFWALLKIKVPFYQYKDSYYNDKTESRSSYLYNKKFHTLKDGLYIETGPCEDVTDVGFSYGYLGFMEFMCSIWDKNNGKCATTVAQKPLM